MENFSKLLASIASVLGAIAWPTAIIILAHIFKDEIKNALIQMGSAIKKLNKAAFAGISLELDRIAEEEANKQPEKGGEVTARQIEAAARIQIKSKNIEPQAILDEMNSLCLQYDTLRKTMPASRERTQAMTGIIVKMRSLAPIVAKNIDIYKSSSSPGSRLAAVAIMQMTPSAVDLNWLIKRFKSDHPFIFYHAALVLQNFYNITIEPDLKSHVAAVSGEALSIIKSFNGVPDRNTISVLQGVLNRESDLNNVNSKRL